MDSQQLAGTGVVVGLAAVALVALVVAALAVSRLRAARREAARREAALRADLDAARAEVLALTGRLEALERSTDPLVITGLGRDGEPAPRPVPDGLVLSAAFGEPLVKTLALGHGIRRALSPEVRHRIRFEMRQETKRSRKQRRREMRQAWREARAEGRFDHATEGDR